MKARYEKLFTHLDDWQWLRYDENVVEGVWCQPIYARWRQGPDRRDEVSDQLDKYQRKHAVFLGKMIRRRQEEREERQAGQAAFYNLGQLGPVKPPSRTRRSPRVSEDDLRARAFGAVPASAIGQAELDQEGLQVAQLQRSSAQEVGVTSGVDMNPVHLYVREKLNSFAKSTYPTAVDLELQNVLKTSDVDTEQLFQTWLNFDRFRSKYYKKSDGWSRNKIF